MGTEKEAGRTERRLLKSSRPVMMEVWTRQVGNGDREKKMNLELLSGNRSDILLDWMGVGWGCEGKRGFKDNS